MADNIVYLRTAPPHPRQIAHAVRIGFSEHIQAEHLIGTNKLAARRFVIEAANVERHKSLLRTLRDMSVEIVLDTNVAELSVPGRFSGSMKDVPWAQGGRMLDADDVAVGTNRSVIDRIARFAIEKEFTTVLAPSHYLADTSIDWLTIDLRAAEALRIALDREGGQHIVVDYALIASYAQLRDPEFRTRASAGIASMPNGHLWIRTGGFGADASPTGISRYIEALRAFHTLDRPIMADHVGGLAGLAACAFGASSGFASGIEGKQRLDTSGWLKPAKKSTGGGGKRIFIPSLDCTLPVEEARLLFHDAKTARQFLGCNDTGCCGDIDKMLSNPEAHRMVQQAKIVDHLSRAPESVRTDEFRKHVEQCAKGAHRATRLKKANEDMSKTLKKSAKRLEQIEDQLKGLHERTGQPDFAPEAMLRAGQPSDGSPVSREGRPL